VSWPAVDATLRGPLAGLRVLDISRILAGPYATMVLADLGADVIKVEHPGSGDESRRWGPPFCEDGNAAYYMSANRSRRSILADLKDQEDGELIRTLADDADVFVENFLPGTTARLGLDAETLQQRNPRLTYATVSGYGSGSERAAWPAVDFVIQADSGLMSVTGPDPSQPMKAGVPISDLTAGLFTVIGILASVAEARETGRGRTVEVSLADASAAILVNQAMNYLVGGLVPRPRGNTHPNVVPYEAIDVDGEQIVLAATSDLQFARLATVIGRPELAEDPRFTTNAERIAHREVLISAIAEALSDRSAEEWVRRLNQAGVAAARVNSVADVFDRPEARERLVVTVADGERSIPQVRSPIRIDGQMLTPRSAPPLLGADDAGVRDALGPVVA
jgi:crotonobetainyl-CoA:carnitine CoA-transferase CaiB-like acyl-CoA transferase